ncbi:hypothetical protein KJ966_15265 [bacterium]|nr:hypothetical protein [bacterium]
MNSKIKILDDYRTEKKSNEELLSENRYGSLHKRFDDLEDLIESKYDIFTVSQPKKASFKYILSLAISSGISGAMISLSIVSILGIISIDWRFFASIFFSSFGVSLASLLIILGVDDECYE